VGLPAVNHLELNQFSHRVERRGELLHVGLDIPLHDVAAALASDTGFRERLLRYLESHIVPDVFEVAEILVREDSTLGTVRWFDDSRGYGFIRSYDGNDVFVHYKDIVGAGYRTLQQGQRVRFKYREGRQSLCAFDVTSVDDAGGVAPPGSDGAEGPHQTPP